MTRTCACGAPIDDGENERLRRELEEKKTAFDSCYAEFVRANQEGLELNMQMLNLCGQLSTSQERVRALEEDRRRMDWLDRGNWQDALSYLVRRFGSYDDLRCAIDAALSMGAALAAEPKEEKP